MIINNLKIKNYRHFEDLNVNFNSKMNVIIGNNGVGKTTILDAATIAIGSVFLSIETNPAPSIKKNDVRIISRKIGSTIDRQPQFPVDISCSGTVDGKSITWSRQLNTESGRTTYGDAAVIGHIADEWKNKIKNGDENVCLPIISYNRRIFNPQQKFDTEINFH